MPSRLVLFLLLAASANAATAPSGDSVGSKVCASCHKTLAGSQARTNMALTWQGVSPAALPPNFQESASEAPEPLNRYRIGRDFKSLTYTVEMPGRAPVQAPVEVVMGGKRHGFSFLARVAELEGLPLSRPVLVEARYLYGTPHSRLELSAGFPPEKPASLEAALGRPLTPEFEAKCLACHGAPLLNKQAQAGVHCEACHGPGKAHLLAVSQGNPKSGVQDGSQSCTQCHNGFTPLADPLPEDLLISSQVTALQNSECFRQSAGAITCTQCHDPHRDASDLKARSEKTCAQCHAVEASTKDRCLGCHVPNAVRGPFEMADHWIRVHPEQAAKSPHTVSPRSKLPVQHEYVRMMALETRAQAEEMRQRVQHGESFFELARDHSLDRTKVSGGYLGDLRLSEAKPALADILRPLAPGDISPVVENGGRFVIFQRFPRDFRWQANQIFEAAGRLRAEGKQAEAAKTYLKALEIYPRFLRALILLGSTLGEGGAPDRAAATLEFAAQLYPNDAGAQYNLGIAYDALKRPADAVQAYQRAIAIEPGLTPAFQNLAADLVEAGSPQEASDWIQKGLRENPLSAILYYNLATVREQLNDKEGSEQARKLAGVLDSRLAAR